MVSRTRPLSRQACIIGVGETRYSKSSGRTPEAQAIEATLAALNDAGIAPRQLDGLIPIGNLVSSEDLIAALNLGVRFSATVQMGGASAVASLQVAVAAVTMGLARFVAIFIGRNGSSGTRIADRVTSLPSQDFKAQLERPFGWTTPAQWYAMICRRHMHAYGTSKEQMGAVAVTMRRHANLNPRAMMYGRELTIDDYMGAEMIVDPYQKFDCCLETDWGAAVIVAAVDSLPRAGKRVYVAGVAEGHPESPDDLTNRADWFHIGLTDSAPQAFEMASLGPTDMDAAMIYDCFTFELMHQLEAAGFCAPGESGQFVASGNIGLSGKLPVNTHGGLLSEGHMSGLNHVIEAVRQLRGECGDRQVQKARHVAVTGWGDLGDGAMAILTNDGS